MESHHHKNQMEHKSAVDPICGMDVDITETSLQYENNVKTYYFCSDRCPAKFTWNYRNCGATKAAWKKLLRKYFH